ncbi:hypothetical protein U1Q18_031699 [Sarracenia purpurea var. burkii]
MITQKPNKRTSSPLLRAIANMKQNKSLLYILPAAILQTAIILIFVLTFMRVRNPKVRLSSVAVENLSVNSSASSPSFSMKLNAQVTVKNTNFGSFKFDAAAATIFYRDSIVGVAVIDKARAKARSTKKLDFTVTVSSKKVGGFVDA